MASRLSPLACLTRLLNHNQCGSIPGLCKFNPCPALTHEIYIHQHLHLKSLTLFLDINGGFDNISSTVLTSLLRRKGIPHYFVSWVRFFLADRQYCLIFQGSPNIFLPIQVGTPQGSPVSPLLFVIHVLVLHIPIPRGIMFSYIDDFTMTVGSLSYQRNCQMFQYLYSVLKRRGARIGISFSILKTKICYWRTPRERASPSRLPVSPNGTLLHPTSSVRWLGYWFTPSMEMSTHFQK